MDNIVGFELVLPNGTVTNVTADAPDPDLFFSLKVSSCKMIRVVRIITVSIRADITTLSVWRCDLKSSTRLKVVQGIVTKITLKTYPQGQVWVWLNLDMLVNSLILSV